jgi:hypothetical protein
MLQQVQIYLSGLMTYALKEQQIDALIPAEPGCEPCAGADHDASPGHSHNQGPSQGRSHGHDPTNPGDAHFPAIVLPLDALDAGTAAPDQVFDSGPDEHGLWKLDGSIVDIWIDGKPPEPSLQYCNKATGEKPDDDGSDAGDLHWLADMKKACGFACELDPACFPPQCNRQLVRAVVRLLEGKAEAFWANEEMKKQVYHFDSPVKKSNVHMPPYEQALADGILWTLDFADAVEVRLTSIADSSVRSIYIPRKPSTTPRIVAGAVSNKPSTIDGASVVEPQESVGHFALYYNLFRPLAGTVARRVPKIPGVSTKTVRCPGSAG